MNEGWVKLTAKDGSLTYVWGPEIRIVSKSTEHPDTTEIITCNGTQIFCAESPEVVASLADTASKANDDYNVQYRADLELARDRSIRG